MSVIENDKELKLCKKYDYSFSSIVKIKDISKIIKCSYRGESISECLFAVNEHNYVGLE